MSDSTPLPAELLTFLTGERSIALRKSADLTRQITQIVSEDSDFPYFSDLADTLRIESESIVWLSLLMNSFNRLQTVEKFLTYSELHTVPNAHRDRVRLQTIFEFLMSDRIQVTVTAQAWAQQ